MIAFQLLLILGGNLAFLNWLTIVNAMACFDDTLLRRLVPRGIGDAAWQQGMQSTPRDTAAQGHAALVGLLALGVAYLSIAPVANLLSPNQAMNRTHDPMRLVNSYGMFGSISDQRLEVILVGTLDDPSQPDAEWREYVFPCKPGPIERAPCIVTPYHHRLDWQVWFTPLTRSVDPWLVHVLYKLLIADPVLLARLAEDPFNGQRPNAIRVDIYRYQFAEAHQPEWWEREWVETFIPPLTLQNPRLIETLEASGLANPP